ncbi:hypothetical protein [Ruminobacter amylophilus]|uniref:hypothetical protein n=1 Tax=Ruminobacter amylophilus TaxID=867 RepID=UPI0038708C9D
MKRSTVCVNIDQSDVTKGGFTDAEKAQARRNIGVTNYNRVTINVIDSMTRNITADDVNVLNLRDFKFYNGHEYHTFVSIPAGIQLANYNKDKVILTVWVGAANWLAAPYKIRFRCDVENGVVKNRTSLIPFDWLAEDLSGDTDVLDYIHMCFFDNDDESTLINLADEQSLNFTFRGTESYVQ